MLRKETDLNDHREQMLERPLPHDAEAERAILGAIMLDNALIHEARRILKPEVFYVPSNCRIYTAMLACDELGVEITSILVADELKREGEFEAVGGLTYITNLTWGLPHFTNIATYARIVVAHARRRYLIKLGDELRTRGLDSDESEDQLAEHFDTRIAAFREKSGAQKRGVSVLAELITPQLERFDRFHKGIRDAVPTGFSVLDENLTGGGLMRSQLHYLAARPSLGKTSLALDIAANAVAHGLSVYFVSLEMSKEVLLDRFFAAAAGVARWKLQPGLYESDLRKLKQVAPAFESQLLFIDDVNRSASAIERSIADTARLRPVDLIIGDYLQLMDTQRMGSRNDQVGANSRALQGMAKKFNAANLWLSQLSRECEKRPKGEPELTDLRDSGEIEQDARTVMFLFGDKGEEDLGDPSTRTIYRDITLKCAKQGEGKLFRTDMPFNKELVTFRSFTQIVGAMNDYSDDARFQ